ncbi:MAG: hypothetical protein FD175_2037 [Beijerinckiaceae bacterium]|nr:MAG: hypothetical protein FD175_2037 [Beijerinckiaceae bacterium]
MAIETANRAAESLLPTGLLDPATREAILSNTMPSFLAAPDGGGILWSSHEAARRFGHAGGAAFMRAGLPPLAAGTQRIAALGRGIAPDAPKRLERLRFNIGFRSQVLTALCEPVRLDDGAIALLVSFIEARPVRTAEPYAVDDIAPPETQSRPAGIPETGPAPQEPLLRRHDDPVPAADLPVADLPARVTESAGPDLSGTPAWLAGGATELKSLRFIFALDANGVVERVTPPLAEAVGAANAAVLGQPLAGFVDAFDAPAAEAIRSAVLAGETWNGIMVRWPVAGTDLVVPVDLSALPIISGEAGLTGFSGFGRCHLDRAEAMSEPVATAATAPEDVEQPDLLSALEAFGEPESIDIAELSALEPESETLADSVSADHEERAEGPVITPAPPLPAARPAEPLHNQNVFSLKTGQPADPQPNGKHGLSMAERNAFREIARALGAKFDPDGQDDTPSPRPSEAETAATDRAASAGAKTPAPSVSTFAPMLPSVQAVKPAEHMPADHALLDRLPVGLLVLKGDEPLFANRTLLDLTDYPDFQTFVAEDGARAIFRKSTMPRDRGAGFDTVVLTSRDGEMIPVDTHLQITDWRGEKATLISLRRAVELEQGKALRSVALDLKRSRSEAQELRAVLDTATDGVVTLDEKGRILSLNGAAEALFGLNQNEVSGESFTTLLLNESHAEALDYFEGLSANGVRSVMNDGRDVFGREKKGGRIPLFMTFGRISDDEPRRYCAVLRDLTSWKRAEAELTDARRAAELASAKKSDFLAKISHEIRTPMNAIIGFAEVMMEERLGPVGNPKYKEYLGDIRTSGKHVVSLVNDLLDLAKIEAGRMEMTFAATDLNAVVASSVGIIQPQANANRVLVRTQLAQKLPPVVADERSIRQIILNMLSNATRFTESGGQVIVATSLLDSGEAVIRIRDTGVGMSSSEIEQALEPFRQVGTRRDHGGTGLGLPLTKALVEANRANFAIRSTPGEGTMVEITFPSTRVLAE